MNRSLLAFLVLSFAAHVVVLVGANSSPPGNLQNRTVLVSLLPALKQQYSMLEQGDRKQHRHNKDIFVTESSDNLKTNKSAIASVGNASASTTQQQRAATASAASIASSPSHSRLMAREIQKLFAARFEYPRIAKKFGHQGQVLVKVTIEANGTINNAQLLKSSGYRTLDLAALRGIRQLRHAPQLQKWLQGKAASINVPVTYRLLET